MKGCVLWWWSGRGDTKIENGAKLIRFASISADGCQNSSTLSCRYGGRMCVCVFACVSGANCDGVWRAGWCSWIMVGGVFLVGLETPATPPLTDMPALLIE